MPELNVRSIVSEYLETNGYDGLVNPGECGYGKEDLMPCGDWSMEIPQCYPAYKQICPCHKRDICELDLETGDACYTLNKPNGDSSRTTIDDCISEAEKAG